MTSTLEIKRGQVYIAHLGWGNGSEQAGARPILILQNDVGNRFSPTTIAAAITDAKHKQPGRMPTHVWVDLAIPSVIMLEQIRTIDKMSIDRYIATLSPEKMKEVENKLFISLGVSL